MNYVIKLRHTLLAEENEIIKISSEIPFIRETYNYESRGFQDIFFLSKYLANFVNKLINL